MLRFTYRSNRSKNVNPVTNLQLGGSECCSYNTFLQFLEEAVIRDIQLWFHISIRKLYMKSMCFRWKNCFDGPSGLYFFKIIVINYYTFLRDIKVLQKLSLTLHYFEFIRWWDVLRLHEPVCRALLLCSWHTYGCIAILHDDFWSTSLVCGYLSPSLHLCARSTAHIIREIAQTCLFQNL